jgi:ribose transport system permease protein
VTGPSVVTGTDETERPSGPGSLREPGQLAGLLGRMGLNRYTGLILWAAFIVIFSIWTPATFLTITTLKSILAVQAITGILALAVIFPLAAGAFDLSVAQNMGFSALLAGFLLVHPRGLPVAVTILVVLIVGALVGLVNGLLVTVAGLDSFIATLATSSLLLAASEEISNGEYIGPFPSSFTAITAPTPLGIPIIAVYLAVLAVVAWYVLEHTPVGRRVQATGANKDSARLAGVSTDRYVVWCMVTCGAGAALGGVLLASSIDSVNQTLGPPYLLPAYAAAFLGTTQIKPGRFNVWGTVVAIFLLATGVQGLELVGAKLYVNDYFNGIALILAVGAGIFVQRSRGRREKRAQLARAKQQA